jgi:UPF0755 protein
MTVAGRRARHGARVAARIAFVLVVSAAAVAIVYPRVPGPGGSVRVEVAIPRGAGPAAVGRAAARAGVVRSGLLFGWYVRLARVTPRLRYGRHRIPGDATPREILAAICRPAPGEATRVTIPEGSDLLDVSEILRDAGVVPADAFLRAARDTDRLARLGVPGPSAEGYLFPDTYDLRAGRAEAPRVVARMVETFHRRTVDALAGLTPAARHDVVVLASIVEEEARAAAERPRIAGVFHNRLRSSDPLIPRVLQADPTVSYGCRVHAKAPSCEAFRGRLARRHTQDAANPYNTYVHAGLPPGPICSPGLASIVAARHPLVTDEVYFVARGDGTHAFARTLSDHERNVRRYRGNPARSR